MRRPTILLLGAGWACLTLSPALAETVIQQCGQQYQAAKAGGTLNGMTWDQYRTDCTTRLKAQPASASVAPVDAPPAASPAAGRTAMLARQRQCGAEWRSNKATLVVQTPGLKWPQYWSQCNKRLKAASQ